MQRITSKKHTKSLILASLVLLCSTAWSYEPDPTHATIAELGVENSQLRLNPDLLPSIGLNAYGENQLPTLHLVSTPSTLMSASDLIEFGAEKEDEVVGNPPLRMLNHFYDPQLDRGLTVNSTEFIRSPDWSLEDVQELDSSESQYYSYRDAREYFRLALTAQVPEDRAFYAGRMFRSIGHVIHHIQDMAQPQHVRNELHCPVKIVCDPIGDLLNVPLYAPSLYEEYVGTIDSAVRSDHASDPYAVSSVGIAHGIRSPRDFWVNQNVPGSGMAEFTAVNFLTQRTSLDWNPVLDDFRPGSILPLPDGSGMYYSWHSCTKSGSLGQVSGVCGGIMKDIFDPVTNISNSVQVASFGLAWAPTVSAFMQSGIGDQYVQSLFRYDREVMESQRSILVPRAIAFSTSIIDYFFRGSVDLERNPADNTWRIVNNGTEEIDGNFTLYSDDSSGLRTQFDLYGWESSGHNFSLQPGGVSSQVYLPPAFGGDITESNLTLVFEGRIGDEGNSQSNSLTAITGKTTDIRVVTLGFGRTTDPIGSYTDLYIDGVQVWQAPFGEFEIVDFYLSPGRYEIGIGLGGAVGVGGAEAALQILENAYLVCCYPLTHQFPAYAPQSTGPEATWIIEVP